MSGPKRMWINQPSKLQPYHGLHGERVHAVPERDDMYRVYFIRGDIISQEVAASALDDGWPKTSIPQFGVDSVARLAETEGPVRVLEALYSKVELTAHVLSAKGDRLGAERVLREAATIQTAIIMIRTLRAAKGEPETIAVFPVPGQYDVRLEVQPATRRELFRVRYGADVRDHLGYRDAAHNLGYCILHALSAAGRIDDERAP